MKRYIISEIIYWAIASISLLQVFKNWESDRQRSYIFMLFGVVSIFMALFRRNFRKKYNKNNQDNSK